MQVVVDRVGVPPRTTLADHAFPPAPTSAPSADMTRGRTRDRSHPRHYSSKPGRGDEYEASTLRGRSRQRASSPLGSPSSPSPGRRDDPSAAASVMSPTRHLLLHNRLRDSRREHCPSRAPSPSERGVRRSRRARSRSRSRGAARAADHHVDLHRPHEGLSGLRNEVHADDGDDPSPPDGGRP